MEGVNILCCKFSFASFTSLNSCKFWCTYWVIIENGSGWRFAPAVESSKKKKKQPAVCAKNKSSFTAGSW
jgi:hypothetical protein